MRMLENTELQKRKRIFQTPKIAFLAYEEIVKIARKFVIQHNTI